jgi:exopolysaccharide biosynthesis polyprenyl glycosylphosphotransferase
LVILLAADFATFSALRLVLHAVRDLAALGSWLAGVTNTFVPHGLVSGAQFAVGLFVALLVTGNYGRGDRRRSPKRLFLGAALGCALPLWMKIWAGDPIVGAHYLAITGLVWGGLLVDRLALNRLVEPIIRRWRQPTRTLFVGSAESCRRAAKSPAFAGGYEYHSVGFADSHAPPAPDALGSADDIARLLHDTMAETVVVCGDLSDARFREVVEIGLGAKCHVMAVPRASDLAGVAPAITWSRGQPLVEIARPVVQAPALLVKRVADFLAAAIGLLLLAPLFILVAVLIKLDSPGPVFFASQRWGKGGRRIGIWKFRTMVDGAAAMLESDPALYAEYAKDVKLRDDPRITRMGRWLRRWSLDELPQLFNVLNGSMSLVGPRPKLLSEEERYGPLFPVVLAVPPGLTGLWQVSGRNNRSYEERITLDVEYVQRCSLWLDLKILLQTIPVVLLGDGAH